MSTTPVTLDPQNTSLEAAQANSMAAAKDTCARMNSNLQIIYLGAFNNWKISVDAGRIDNTNPPKPPVGYVVVTGPDGFSYPELGTAAVCDMPPIPADCSKPQPTVLPAPTTVRNCPAGDTAPVGFIVTGPDGSQWQKQGTPTPFGVAYYYTKIA